MDKLTLKVAISIIIVGLFAVVIFVALSYQKLDITFYIVFIFFAIYIFFFGIATGQSFTTPLKKLLERATEISKGNLSSRVYLESKDEFAELAKVFNKIAEELETSHTEEENAEKSVGIKVQARTQELEETINALEQKVKNRTIELERLIEKSSKLQEDAKNKEAEEARLRKELADLKQKAGKGGRPKKEI